MNYDYDEVEEEEFDLCGYTGNECIGDKMFCEECRIWEAISLNEREGDEEDED